MINEVGGLITTIWVVALVKEGPSINKVEEDLSQLPKLVHPVIVVLLSLVAIQEAFSSFDSFLPIQLTNLVVSSIFFWVHEAGHFYFSWASEFLHVLGGTLVQFLVPLIPAIVSFNRRCFRVFGLCLYFVGYNCFSTSKYAGDARAKILPLVTPDPDAHDWNYMLGKLGILDYDQSVATLFAVTGWLIIAISLFIYLFQRTTKRFDSLAGHT